MLTLHLAAFGNQVKVHINGKESHQFSLFDMSLSQDEWKSFLANPRVYGEKLFNALFRDAALSEFEALSNQTERTIVLVLEAPELDSIAWEYAYHGNAYIVEDFAFIRALPEKERPHSNGRMTKSVERLPLLYIPANPLIDLNGEPMRELDIESEWREMTQHIVKSNAPFDLIELRPATPAALQSVMARFKNGMIAHFSGHGAATKDGAFLLFENENGSSNPLEAREFVREVKDQAWIGFLSACQSAVAERTAYSNLARELVKAGVPFALGMQFNLPDLFAPNISGQFYNYLSQGHAVPEAVRQARRAVKRENEFYVGMIALVAAHPDEAGKMEWSGSGARTVPTFAAADLSDLPTPSGFLGRQRELMNIGTSLLEKKKPNTVTLHGAGGIGKTALMWQALLRFAPSFESTLAIALDPLPSLESVLGRLERFLNLPSTCSNDTKERERIVHERLTGKRTLLSLDNFETLNYALNDKGSDEEKTAKSLHSFFKYLAANGVTLCVTSREVTNLGGELIIDIEGLPNDIGGRLFQDNVVRQKDEIYIEKTQKVSEMIGGHPLALRLLASAFDDQVGMSLDQYIEDLQSHLPKARDKWTEEDRHESLRSSFDFTMNNLLKVEGGKDLQTALSRLSVFIAFFVDFTAAPTLEGKIFETQEEFEQIRPRVNSILHTLWDRGLLERAAISIEDENYYLYRLHPVLRPFAQEHLTDRDAVKVKENYWLSMSKFVRLAEGQITRSALIAQITLRAVPDLIVVAEEANNNREFIGLPLSTAKLLRHFGLYDDASRLLDKYKDIPGMFFVPKLAAMQEQARIYITRGDLDRAMELYQQSFEAFDLFRNSQGKANALYEMGYISEIRGDIAGAMKFYTQALELLESFGIHKNKAVVMNRVASLEAERGNLDKAIELKKEVIVLTKQFGEQLDTSIALSDLAMIYAKRGDLDEAMQLCQDSLEIKERFGDKDGKAAIFGNLAQIYVLRGEFQKALNLYKQSLTIFDELSDLRGKASILNSMGIVLFQVNRDADALKSLLSALEIRKQLQEKLKIESTIFSLNQFQQAVGFEEFQKLWEEVTGSEELPDWLMEVSQTSEISEVEQFIAGAIRFAREKRPEAEQYFKEAQRLASDSNAPAELQSLGKVLQRIMIGQKNVDISALPSELRKIVEKALEG